MDTEERVSKAATRDVGKSTRVGKYPDAVLAEVETAENPNSEDFPYALRLTFGGLFDATVGEEFEHTERINVPGANPNSFVDSQMRNFARTVGIDLPSGKTLVATNEEELQEVVGLFNAKIGQVAPIGLRQGDDGRLRAYTLAQKKKRG